MKKIVKYFDYSLQTDKEYTLEEIREEARKIVKRGNYPINIHHYKLNAYTEYGVYGGGDYARFDIVFFREETDEEYNTRLELEKKQEEIRQKAKEKREQLRIKQEERKKAKWEEAQKLALDPEYQELQRLLTKFNPDGTRKKGKS